PSGKRKPWNHSSARIRASSTSALIRRSFQRENDEAARRHQAYQEHPSEALGPGGRREPFPRVEQGHVGNTRSALTQAISLQAIPEGRGEVVANGLRSVGQRQGDQLGPLLAAGVGVIDGHTAARGQGLTDENELATARAAVVAEQVLADVG